MDQNHHFSELLLTFAVSFREGRWVQFSEINLTTRTLHHLLSSFLSLFLPDPARFFQDSSSSQKKAPTQGKCPSSPHHSVHCFLYHSDVDYLISGMMDLTESLQLNLWLVHPRSLPKRTAGTQKLGSCPCQKRDFSGVYSDNAGPQKKKRFRFP